VAKNQHSFPEIEGLRVTKYRQVVYNVLMDYKDHPTASEVYDRAREVNPDISLATVYNCLDALAEHGAIRQVNFDRESSRYCPNLMEHGHFYDSKSGVIHDITFKDGHKIQDFLNLPNGVVIEDLEITIRGSLKHS